jgi:hypothetical protein
MAAVLALHTSETVVEDTAIQVAKDISLTPFNRSDKRTNQANQDESITIRKSGFHPVNRQRQAGSDSLFKEA